MLLDLCFLSLVQVVVTTAAALVVTKRPGFSSLFNQIALLSDRIARNSN